MHNVPKWSDTLKISQHLLQDFKSVFDHFGTLCITGLKLVLYQYIAFCVQNYTTFKERCKNLIKS